MAAVGSQSPHHSHPYYPPEAELAGYLANEYSVLRLLVYFAIGCASVLGTALVVATHVRPSMNRADRFAILWFVLSGSLHCFFEGYFVVNHAHMAAAQDLFGQLWKEYSLSDSRYLNSDPIVLCMETITVMVWGPLCFLVAYLITVQHSLRYPFQIIVCMAHLYGDVLYYATSLFDHYFNGVSYCRPEAYYFWGYYFFMNFIWIVVPFYYLCESITRISRAFQKLNRGAVERKSE
ncbi:EBP domain-containing protein [Paecilomyces variotii No. 5]|uniref:EBP domain-containing protein n=1 Tax=Byssochlamys spectabilis (strain No. 5 / NBRC 109023) TaxID=1356009 RepID=V5HWW0_BYSSN|nr:EBP domain-containing protein [Paecilomyces variotii No. 5]